VAVVRAGVRRRLETHPSVIICSSNMNDYIFLVTEHISWIFFNSYVSRVHCAWRTISLSPCAGENVVLYDCLPDGYVSVVEILNQ
jgi:hypothetical protein